ncbi:MAG: hypothetical protein QHH07_00030 [Sedimentisphaerales bacterium]|nr:hypothetical protein [Sedimentisphaerales bacterium]
MGKREYTDYQRSVISGYYEHKDTIMLQRLQELVGELYLADSQQKKARLWQRVEKAMANLGVPKGIADHIMSKQDPQILAKNIQDWLRMCRA